MMQFACLPTGSVPSLFSSSLCVANCSSQPFLCIPMQLQWRCIHLPLSLCRLFRSSSSPYLQTTHPYKCALACKSCPFSTCREASRCLSSSHLCQLHLRRVPTRPFSPLCLRLAVSPAFFHRPPLLALFHRPPPMTQNPTVDVPPPPPPLHDDFGEKRCGVIRLHRTKKAYTLLDLPWTRISLFFFFLKRSLSLLPVDLHCP